MRAFVTGASGFVGTHLLAHLTAMGDEVIGIDPDLDLAAPGADITSLVAEAAPDVVYHLAAWADVGASWDSPRETYRVNVIGTSTVLEAAARMSPSPRVVFVSSSEVYGKGHGGALDETCALEPISPYAASKAAAEMLAIQAHLGRSLDVIRVRPFNHVGPGQNENFVVAALTKRVVEAEIEHRSEIVVGNLEAERDFTDVRDVVRAYRMLAEKGEAGCVYNVCSGHARSIKSVLDDLIEIAGMALSTRTDPALLRPVDLPLLLGDPAAINAVGWEPRLAWRDTLADTLAWWRSRLS